ncbi:3-methylfumaryl-CoA hydratase [Tamaricihabitans halophyticus]|uniref:3-methylfumaryl-CoA hydratase n=1 Tax=Tamaricihabitans halophyticus TaxID=1262583 RepID=A0A4R2PW45_9PSEU|nr:MaoC family dehydratase N-terminal domain-containing protein [Tamaricihabitans halophyticus]TCP39358.1 3-methylfumaryl-CoA hydratase [Tamaricihabitans halophyticus]
MPTGSSVLGTYVDSWDPGPVTDEEVLSAEPVAALSAVLNQSKSVAGVGEALPPLWQWLYFLRWPKQDELGEDGHPRDGHFLPPIPDRQRMFAGGRCEISEPLSVGARTERISSIANVAVKQGRTGEMVFVTQRNEFRQHGRTCLVEEQDIVYRSGKSAGDHPVVVDTSATPQSDGEWQLADQPDPALLFRFSALTANAHRIHYDSPYVLDEEGYPGLVVHGPLLAVLMLELLRRNEPRRVRSLSFRLRSPVFAGEQVVASGNSTSNGAVLQVATHRDARHATAEVTFA